MQKQTMVIEFDGERVRATHYCGGKERSADMYNFDEESDFLYCCAYLIDEMAKPKPTNIENGLFAKTVCISAIEGEGFTVGKIYSWENGRTANDALEILPRDYKLGASLEAKRKFVIGGNEFLILREV